MKERRKIKTSKKEIVDYWSGHVDECGLSVDWADADCRCWRCGCKKNLQRCHIIPDSLGGKDEASNLVLLCTRCHEDGPNVKDPEIMWDWIKAYGVPFYDTFWTIVGMKEYGFIYGHSMESDLKNIIESSAVEVTEENVQSILQEKMSSIANKANVHFGQPYLNTATMAGLYRMMLKELARELGVEFPLKEEKVKNKIPWWLNSIQ